MKLLAATLFVFVLSGSIFACSENGAEGILPRNKMRIPVGLKMGEGQGGLNQSQFNAVIDKVEGIYSPIVKNMGATLKVTRMWTDSTVNAFAHREDGPLIWTVDMYGGLARHRTITEDGFTLVLCHEIGHQIGGAPKVKDLRDGWAANEGQADYFGTLKCLRKVFLNDNNEMAVKKLRLKLRLAAIPETLVKACTKAWANKDDKNICIRSGLAGQSVSDLFAALNSGPEAKFETPDTHVVNKTDDAHPAYQCRLDTFFQGALCEKSFNEDVSQTDEVKGTCHTRLNDKIGLRPLCWFKPKK